MDASVRITGNSYSWNDSAELTLGEPGCSFGRGPAFGRAEPRIRSHHAFVVTEARSLYARKAPSSLQGLSPTR
jgi:hypothetical protein